MLTILISCPEGPERKRQVRFITSSRKEQAVRRLSETTWTGTLSSRASIGAVAMHEWVCIAYWPARYSLPPGVLQTPKPNLGVGMRWLQSAYAQDVNYRHARSGHLFGGRFYSVRLKRENHLVSAVMYVLINPARAGVVEHPADWPWCSYGATVASEPPSRFLARTAVLELFGGRPDTPRRLAQAVRETLARDSAGGMNGV